MHRNIFPPISKLRSRLIVALALGVGALPCLGATIDFEDTAFGTVTLLGDRYLSEGLRISGNGPFSGVAYSEGMFGVQNFGNSSTQVMDIGLRTEPTFFRFVDQAQPSATLGATSVRFLAGDGNPDVETFMISFFDVQDQLLSASTYTTTTESVEVLATSASFGALIGLIRLEVLRDSGSGAVIDDLVFSQMGVTQVPEPSTALMVLAGLVAVAGISRRHNRRPDRAFAGTDA